jgi:parallel beta-helix repeat protein
LSYKHDIVAEIIEDSNQYDLKIKLSQLAENGEKIQNERDVTGDGEFTYEDKVKLYSERKRLLEQAHRELEDFDFSLYASRDENFADAKTQNQAYGQLRGELEQIRSLLSSDYHATTSWLKNRPSKSNLAENSGAGLKNRDADKTYQFATRTDVDTLSSTDDYALYEFKITEEHAGDNRNLYLNIADKFGKDEITTYVTKGDKPTISEPESDFSPSDTGSVEEYRISDESGLDQGEKFYLLVKSDGETTYRLFSSTRNPGGFDGGNIFPKVRPIDSELIEAGSFTGYASPSIESIEIDKRKISPGESFTLSVNIKNAGQAADWQSIALSFPQLQDTSRITVLSDDIGNEGPTVIGTGEDLYSRYGYEQITSQYPHIEIGKQDWGPGEEHELRMRVTPQSEGEFPVLVKSVARTDDVWSYAPRPATQGSVTVDEQGEYVSEELVTVSTEDEQENQAPSVSISGPSEVTVGQEFSLETTATDPDDPLDELTYEWSTRRAPDGAAVTLPADDQGRLSLSVAGSYAFEVVVRDRDGGTDRATIQIEVKQQPNQPPDPQLSLPSDATTQEELTFSATGSSDPDGSITDYRWDFDGDGTIDARGETATYTYESSGEYTVVLAVEDDDGATERVRKTLPVAQGVKSVDSCMVIDNSGTYKLTSDISSQEASTCLDIRSNDVVVRGAGYAVDGDDSSETIGIRVKDASNVVLDGLTVQGWGQGIKVVSARDIEITNSNVRESSDENLRILSSSGVTISSNEFVTQSSLSPTRAGPHGVLVMKSQNVNITDNSISNPGIGVYLASTTEVDVENNEISGSSVAGIELSLDTADTRVAENRLNTNRIGIKLGDTRASVLQTDIIVIQNEISDSQVGIRTVSRGEYRIERNSIVGSDEWDIRSTDSSVKVIETTLNGAMVSFEKGEISVVADSDIDSPPSTTQIVGQPLTFVSTGEEAQLELTAAYDYTTDEFDTDPHLWRYDQSWSTIDQQSTQTNGEVDVVVELSKRPTVVAPMREVNEPPEIIGATAPEQTYAGADVRLYAAARDPDGVDLSYQWSVVKQPEDANVDLPGGRRVDLTLSTTGIYEFKINVTDSEGASTTRTLQTEVTSLSDRPVRQIDSCTDIEEAGKYVITSDVLKSEETELSCIQVYASDVVIDGDGHTLDGNEVGMNGIRLQDTVDSLDNITVKNVQLQGWRDGIYTDVSTNVSVVNSTIESNENGIFSGSSSEGIIENNTIRNNSEAGVFIASGSDTAFKITRNTISENRVGVEAQSGEINSNLFSNNDVGVSVSYLDPDARDSSNRVTVDDNIVRESTQVDISTRNENTKKTQVTNLSLDGTTTSFDAKSVSVTATTVPGSGPSDAQVIGQALELSAPITESTYSSRSSSYPSGSYLNVTMDYSDPNGELGKDEVSVWKYNGTWFEVNGQVTVQTSENEVTANVTAEEESVIIVPVTTATEAQDLEPLCEQCGSPSDLDGDGKYEDVNGNGVQGFGDVVTLFDNLGSESVTENTELYDYNDNGVVGFGDVIQLFETI